MRISNESSGGGGGRWKHSVETGPWFLPGRLMAQVGVFLGLSTAHKGPHIIRRNFPVSQRGGLWRLSYADGGEMIGVQFSRCIGFDSYQSEWYVSWIKPHRWKKPVGSVGVNLRYRFGGSIASEGVAMLHFTNHPAIVQPASDLGTPPGIHGHAWSQSVRDEGELPRAGGARNWSLWGLLGRDGRGIPTSRRIQLLARSCLEARSTVPKVSVLRFRCRSKALPDL